MKNIILTLVFSISLISCSQDDGFGSPEDSDYSGVLLKKVIGNGHITKYNYIDGNKLSSISFGEEDLILFRFTYTGDLITEVEYGDEVTIYTYLDGRVSQAHLYASGYDLVQKNEYVYDDINGTMTVISKHMRGDDWEVSYKEKNYVDTNFNVVKSEWFQDGFIIAQTTEYVFDLKSKNPFRNIRGFDQPFMPMFGLTNSFVGFGSSNSWVKRTITYPNHSDSMDKVSVVDYAEYNSLGYPLTTSGYDNNGEFFISNYY